MHSQWTILKTSPNSLTSLNVAFSRLASLVASFSFLFFVAVGFEVEASVTLYCRQLRDWRTNAIYDRKWATAENGGTGGRLGDYKVFPQLEPYYYDTASGSSGFWYWPKLYGNNVNNSPIAYTVKASTAQNLSVPDSYTSQITNIINSIESQFNTAAKRSAIDTISLSFNSSGEPVIAVTTFNFGLCANGVVYTWDETGFPIASYKDSTGFVPGYEPIGPDGSLQKVYYDTSQVNNGYALRLDSLSGINSTSLQYDSATGLYSYSAPDYSYLLSSINQGVNQIANNTITIDNIQLEIPTPEITVEPQVTVNPTVTVTPDVTVNVTAPTQNDITVAIDNSDLIASIVDLNGSVDVSTTALWGELFNVESLQRASLSQLQTLSSNYTSKVVDDFDTATLNLSQEEHDLLNVVEGWETQIPVISNACDFAFGAAFGNIPTIPPSDLVPISGINVLGFSITIDLRPYVTHFRWFRAFCLLLEVVWFLNSLWTSAIKAMQV